MLVASVRRRVEINESGFTIHNLTTRRVVWRDLQAVTVASSGIGCAVRVRMSGDRFSRLLPIGGATKNAQRRVARLAQTLDGHRPH
jgi:hypothetical protein